MTKPGRLLDSFAILQVTRVINIICCNIVIIIIIIIKIIIIIID